MMKIHLLLTLLLPFFVYSQTPEQDLEKGIEAYNAFNEFVGTFATPESMDAKASADAKERVTKGLALLDKAIQNGNADQIRTARYFKLNFRYRNAFLLGFKGDRMAAFAELKAIREDMERLNAAQFPISYPYYGQNYTIRYENFAPQQSEFYATYSEFLNEIGKDKAGAYQYARKAIESSYASAWTIYTAAIIVVEQEATNDPGLQKYPTSLLAELKAYTQLSAPELAMARKENSPTSLVIGHQLADLTERNTSFPDRARISGEAAILLAELDERDDYAVLRLFQAAEKENVAADDALAFARSRQLAANIRTDGKKLSTEQIRIEAARLGSAVLDRRRASVTTGTDCPAMLNLANDYDALGDRDRAADLRRQARTCQALRQRADQRKANQFNVYAGVFPIPLLARADRLDLGGHLDFCFPRFALSFGYVVSQHKRDWNTKFGTNDEKYRWDGWRGRFAIKKYARRGRGTYSGLLFGYAEKKHYINDNQRDYMTAVVRQNGTLSEVQFRPLDRQYEVLLISGVQPLGRLFGSDLCFGLGGSINQFDGGNALWNQPNVEITGNKLLSDRHEWAFFPQIYLNWSIGLNVGRKR